MRFDVITIFPLFFEGFLNHGILTRALTSGSVTIAMHDLRSFTHDRHKTVDDRPFGGGEGMVLKPGPLFEALESLQVAPRRDRDPARESVILLSAQGRPFTQALAQELAGVERVIFICGRYEGVDERVNDELCDRELSIGDYILSGGELGAAVIIDSIIIRSHRFRILLIAAGIEHVMDRHSIRLSVHHDNTPEADGREVMTVAVSTDGRATHRP